MTLSYRDTMHSTLIFKECGDAIFGRVKCNKREISHFVTLPRIQRIQYDIKHLGGEFWTTQECFSGEVSRTSLMVYQHYLIKFQAEPDKSTNFHSFILSQKQTLHKILYNKRMSEIYACAYTTDKKRVASVLLGGSAKKMMSNGNYFSMPTGLVSHVKSVTKDDWSKLYTRQDTPDVPKLWLSTPLVIDMHKRVKAEPFQWPVPSNIADFQAML